jgi:formate C-acetyltransferase
MKSYDEFFQAYLAQLEHFAKRMVYLCNRGELAQREKGSLPCWSLLTDDCVKRGRDITDGGAIYNFHSIAFVGAADTADSLMALRRMLFDGGKVKAPELLAALKANFAGHENLRQALLAEPKYGNDNDEVDLIARDICERFIALMDRMESPLGGRYFVHLFSFIVNLIFGEVTGATPDGRLAGEPTAYSLSAHQGRDRNGVAAMLKSLSRMPHNQAAGASAAIVDLTPDLVQGEQGRKRLVSIIKAAMAMGVGQLQMNVVTTERLRQAKADPLHYGNIPVRVAGYSQLFNLLSDPLQDHVIARTKHER